MPSTRRSGADLDARGHLRAHDDAIREALELALEDRWGEDFRRARPAAVALGPDGHSRVLLPSLWAGTPAGAHFQLGFPIEAAAFHPDGERLLLYTQAELLELAWSSRTIVRRIPAP